MDAKQKAAILIIPVIVQCRDIAYVAQIANVLLAFVKKLLDKCDQQYLSILFFIYSSSCRPQDFTSSR